MATLTEYEQIRWMIRRDLPDVLRIERDSFDAAWTAEEFLSCLRLRNCIGMVHIDAVSRDVTGFMIYELYRDWLQILNLAVRRSNRRSGVGSRMIARLKNKLSQQRRTELAVVIRDSNLEGQLFFQRNGFIATNVMRSHFCNGEDAYEMRYMIPDETWMTVENIKPNQESD